MTSLPHLDHLTPEQLRALAAQLIQRVETLDQQVETMGKTVETMGKKINRDQTVIEKLTPRDRTTQALEVCQAQRAVESAAGDYTPGVFTVERHVSGKWVCDDCETLTQHPFRHRSSTRVSRPPGYLPTS